MLFPISTETRSVRDLSGIWQFKRDQNNSGFQENWSNGLPQPTLSMPVPSSYNDITQDVELKNHIGWVWYQTTFRLPMNQYNKNLRHVLRFESAQYYCVVFLNGKKIMSHDGGHLPFEMDISSDLKEKEENLLIAAVNNTLTSNTLPPGIVYTHPKESDSYPKGYVSQATFFDFFNYAGLHRPVKLYSTPQTYIDDITINYKLLDNGNAEVHYKILVVPSQEDNVQVKLVDHQKNVVASAKSATGSLTVANAKLWSPNNPYLYTLEVFNGNEGDESYDVYRLETIGIRKIHFSDKQFFINDKPVYFHGLDKHEDENIRGRGLDYITLMKDFNLIEWLNVNSIRTSHYPYAEEFYFEANKRGIMIIDESTAVGLAKSQFFNKETLEHHKNVMLEMIRRDKNHPSVVMWSIANEPSSNLPEADPYFKEVSNYTRTIDPTQRPLTLVQNQDFNQPNCAQYFDIICVNRYYAWYTNPGHIELIRRQLSFDLDGWHQKFKKPIIVSEYGADTLSLHEDPPVMFTEEFQIDFMAEYQKVFDVKKKDYLIGELVWNFADFKTSESITRVGSLNRKGILTRERQPKPVAFQLRERYRNFKDQFHQ